MRELTLWTRGISLKEMIEELATYLKGWRGYFAFSETPTVSQRLDKWIGLIAGQNAAEEVSPAVSFIYSLLQ